MYLLYTLLVCLCPINVKTVEEIGPKFCVGPHVTQGKVYEWWKFVLKSFICAKNYYEICKLFIILYKEKIKSGKRRCLSQHRYFLRKKSKTWGHILERCQSFLCEKNNNIDCSFFKINSRYRVRLLRRQTELIQFLSLHFRFLALINILITFLKHILYH